MNTESHIRLPSGRHMRLDIYHLRLRILRWLIRQDKPWMPVDIAKVLKLWAPQVVSNTFVRCPWFERVEGGWQPTEAGRQAVKEATG